MSWLNRILLALVVVGAMVYLPKQQAANRESIAMVDAQRQQVVEQRLGLEVRQHHEQHLAPLPVAGHHHRPRGRALPAGQGVVRWRSHQRSRRGTPVRAPRQDRVATDSIQVHSNELYNRDC